MNLQGVDTVQTCESGKSEMPRCEKVLPRRGWGRSAAGVLLTSPALVESDAILEPGYDSSRVPGPEEQRGRIEGPPKWVRP